MSDMIRSPIVFVTNPTNGAIITLATMAINVVIFTQVS